MKKVLFLSFLFVAVTSLEAYSKKIIFATFSNEQNAQKSLNSFEKTESYEKLKKLSLKHDFKIYTRASGRFYIVVAEPFFQRKTAVKAYKIIKQKYKNLYANIYTPPETQQVDSNKSLLKDNKKEKVVKVEEKDTKILKVAKVPVKSIQITTLEKKKAETLEVKAVEEEIIVKEKSLEKTVDFAMDILDILLYLSVVIFLGVIIYYYIKLKRIYDEY